jgi:hypothetical protein
MLDRARSVERIWEGGGRGKGGKGGKGMGWRLRVWSKERGMAGAGEEGGGVEYAGKGRACVCFRLTQL